MVGVGLPSTPVAHTRVMLPPSRTAVSASGPANSGGSVMKKEITWPQFQKELEYAPSLSSQPILFPGGWEMVWLDRLGMAPLIKAHVHVWHRDGVLQSFTKWHEVLHGWNFCKGFIFVFFVSQEQFAKIKNAKFLLSMCKANELRFNPSYLELYLDANRSVSVSVSLMAITKAIQKIEVLRKHKHTN